MKYFVQDQASGSEGKAEIITIKRILPIESPSALRLVDELKSSRSGPKGLRVERSILIEKTERSDTTNRQYSIVNSQFFRLVRIRLCYSPGPIRS